MTIEILRSEQGDADEEEILEFEKALERGGREPQEPDDRPTRQEPQSEPHR